MTVFKCDICGAFYDPYNFYGNQETDKPNTICLARNSASLMLMPHIQTFDTCPECMEAFEKFLKSRHNKGDDSA